MYPTPWLMRQPSASRRFRLYCFSYAGGSASAFLPWQAAVSPAVEICAIQLPGRGARLAEAPCTSWTGLVESLADVIVRDSRLPFAFLGHSMGALVAFELARHCRHRHLPGPEHLFVSGCNAPQRRGPMRRLHELDDRALIGALRDYGGTPPEVLANDELMMLVLPAIRADFALVADYRYSGSAPLAIPLTVMAGLADPHTSTEQVLGWRDETSGPCQARWFPGDHFFIQSDRAAVLRGLNEALAQLGHAPPPAPMPERLLVNAY